MKKHEFILDAKLARHTANCNQDYEYNKERKEIFERIEAEALKGKYSCRYDKTIMPKIANELVDLGFFVRENLIEWHEPANNIYESMK